MPPPSPVPPPPSQPRPALSLLDSTSIIVGIIIGSAIYEISPIVATSAGGWAAGTLTAWSSSPPTNGQLSAVATAAIVSVWIAGGAVALLGALCYAELGTAYPQAGGTYVYLSAALGRTVGFAFAWAEFWIVRPGNIGAVAFVLARYGVKLLPTSFEAVGHLDLMIALAAIVALSALNALGLRAGTRTQNLLSAIKVVGLMAIILTAISLPSPAATAKMPAQGTLSLALILIMFAYGGWADMSFVAAEVRDPQRNLLRALLLGTGAVALIYVTINLAFLHALGIGGLANTPAVAAEVLGRRLGEFGSRTVSLLVVLSCLGAVNGMLLTGSRVFYAVGVHHPVFRWLGAWNERTGVPLRSLLMQTLVTIGLVIAFGLRPGGFQGLVVFTGFFYWVFIGLVGLALILLRRSAASTFRVPFFPWPPLVFWLTSSAMAFAAGKYAVEVAVNSVQKSGTLDVSWLIGAIWAAAVVTSGIVVGIFDWRSRSR